MILVHRIEKIGITFNDHFNKINEFLRAGSYVYKVVEFKDNGASNFFSLGICAGMVTGYRFYYVSYENGRDNFNSTSKDPVGNHYVCTAKSA